MIFSNSSYKGYSRPGDSHIINLTNNEVSPGVYDPNGKKISLHIDENNKLYYLVVLDGLIKKIYIQSSNEEYPPYLSKLHLSQIDLGCVKKGLVFAEGYTIEDLIVDLFERNDLIPILATGTVIFLGASDSNKLEVLFTNETTTVTHSCKINAPGFLDSEGKITPVPNYEYNISSENGTIEADRSTEHSYPVIYKFAAIKDYTATELGLGIELENGTVLPSLAIIPSEEIIVASELLISYKWVLATVNYQENMDNFTYSQILNAPMLSGWINLIGDTLVKDTITIQPNLCVVLMVPNKSSIDVTAKKLGTTSTWNSISPLKGNQNMKIYYINVPNSGVESEYTQLKITRKL